MTLATVWYSRCLTNLAARQKRKLLARQKRKEVNEMKVGKSLLAAMLLASSLGASNAFAADDVTAGNYCHMKFPAIAEESEVTANPVLQENPSTGEIIDFYGPCNTNPVGRDQVQHQRNDLVQNWEFNYGD
jgi:hypothetical protein